MNSASFLQMDQLLLPAPLPALVAFLIFLGLWWTGDRVAALWFGKDRQLIHRGAGFVIAVATVASLIQACALIGCVSIWGLRSLGWMLAVVGCIKIWEFLRYLPSAAHRMTHDRWDRNGMFCTFVIALIGIGLTGAALGPATDADSLDYHLGVPMDWLRNGGAYPRPDWFHARLVGIGESSNLLGLAAGTDCLGAAMQIAGLVLACIAVCSLTANREQRLFGILMVAVCPVMLFLVPNQKPQLFPAAVMTLGISMLLRDSESMDGRSLIMGIICVNYAIANKYSFLLTGRKIMLTVWWTAYRQGRFRIAVITTVITFFLLPGPVYLRNFLFYGDPFSPIFERFLSASDPALIEFNNHLREYGGEITPLRFLLLPLTTMIPVKSSELSGVLGVGMLGGILVFRSPMKQKKIIVCAAAAIVAILLMGQMTARFFLEPYLWIAMVVAAQPQNRMKRILQSGLCLQGLAVAVMAIYGAVVLFPGALSDRWRAHVLGRFKL